MKKVMYPGTFDPVTNGHIDIINRAKELFDAVVVTVAVNPGKTPLFSTEERLDLLRETLKDYTSITVDSFDGLVVDHAHEVGAIGIIRGLRAVSDFEYEFQMALMNRRQTKKVETVFLMSGFRWFYTSSNLIKEVASLGGSVKGLVPENVHQKLMEKFNINKTGGSL